MVTSYGVGAIAAGEGDALFYSRTWHNTAATPVIYCHHATGQARSTVAPVNESDASIRTIIERVTAGGLPVIANDQGGSSNWGADPAPARVDGALARVNSVLGARTDRVLLLADSMGAVVALNWARANPSKVAGVALLIPVVNLQHAHDNAASPLPANIETAYGGLAAYQAALPTRNPAANASAYLTMPVKLWYSDDDLTAVASQVASFASAAGGQPTVSMGAVGHTIPAAFDLASVADWLLAHA